MTASDGSSLLRPGGLVRVYGLKSATALNGQLGRLVAKAQDGASGRWGVVLSDGSSRSIKADNLFSLDAYLKWQSEGVAPVCEGGFVKAPPAQDAVVLAKEQATSKKTPLARKRSPAPSSAEEASGNLSKFTMRQIELDEGKLSYAVIAPPTSEPEGERRPLPTVLAISRGEQRHVARFVRSLRAEARGWQVVVAMRQPDAPDLYDVSGSVLLHQFLEALLKDRYNDLLDYNVLSGVFHLVGVSNGGAAALALAARAPELTASLSVVTGFLPEEVEGKALQFVRHVHFYVGDKDEMGHDTQLLKALDDIQTAGGQGALHIVKGASHYNIGDHINKEAFWARLERAR